MKDEPIHHAYRPKGAVPLGGEAPQEAPPSPLPAEVVRGVLDSPSLPLFLFRPTEAARCAREVAAAFPGFYFPVKCNPHPKVVSAVLGEGAGLSLRSFGELDLALRLGGPPSRLSFTGWGLGPALMERLIRLGVTVNLDSAREVADWVAHFPDRPFGVRLMAGDDPEYLSAGFAHDEVGPMMEKVRERRARLTGVLVHWPHAVASAGQMAREFAPLPRLLENTLGPALGELEYLNLGGGWPAPYAGGEPIPAGRVAEVLGDRLLPALRAAGFAGRLAVEPGRAVAASCGYWAARVLKVGSTGSTGSGPLRPGPRLFALLETPPPVPPLCLPYPVHLLRDGEEVFPGSGPPRPDPSLPKKLGADPAGLTPIRLLGLACPPVDLIREQVLLPRLKAGDLLVFAQAGAYLKTGLLAVEREGKVREVVLGP